MKLLLCIDDQSSQKGKSEVDLMNKSTLMRRKLEKMQAPSDPARSAVSKKEEQNSANLLSKPKINSEEILSHVRYTKTKLILNNLYFKY